MDQKIIENLIKYVQSRFETVEEQIAYITAVVDTLQIRMKGAN